MTSEFWHKRFSQQANWTKETRDYLFNKSSITSNSKVLEIGCGTGAILSTLPNCNSFGLDINLSHLFQLQSIFPNKKILQADALVSPFADETFDIVFFHYFLLWIQKPEILLKEITRILKPNGFILACAEPDYSGRIDYPPELEEIGKLQTLSLKFQGADPTIGKKLPFFFSKIDVTILDFGVINGSWNSSVSTEEHELEWKVIVKDLKNSISNKDITKYKQLEYEAIKNQSFVRFIPTFYLIAKKIKFQEK